MNILGRVGRTLRIKSARVPNEVLTPARSGIRGSSLFASKGGFPEHSGTSISADKGSAYANGTTHR